MIDEPIDALQAKMAHIEAPGVSVAKRLGRGAAVEQIVAMAKEMGCDLILMGTHGRGGVGRLLLGSVAEGVMRKAPCPVLTVKALPVHLPAEKPALAAV